MNSIYNRTDEESSVIGEVQDNFIANYPLYQQGFKAGAASRDAEVAELKTVPMKYRRMEFNAQLQDEVAKLEKENDQLREQVALLQVNLRRASNYVDSLGGDSNQYRQVLAATETKP